jgi:hypothetical protein
MASRQQQRKQLVSYVVRQRVNGTIALGDLPIDRQFVGTRLWRLRMLVNLLNRLLDTVGDEGHPPAEATGSKTVADDDKMDALRRDVEYQRHVLTRLLLMK